LFNGITPLSRRRFTYAWSLISDAVIYRTVITPRHCIVNVITVCRHVTPQPLDDTDTLRHARVRRHIDIDLAATPIR